jgi:prevent-host-death family protein
MTMVNKYPMEVGMHKIETITISKFKATCLSVLDGVKKTGRSVMVTRHGRPIAVIEPPPPPKKKASWLGSFKSSGKIIGDVVSPAVSTKDWRVLND